MDQENGMNSLKADIAILTIREDEFSAVFNRLEQYQFETPKGPSGRTYAIFSVPIKRSNEICTIAMARSPEQGSDVSHLVASDIIQDLDPQILLIVGIADGVPNDEFSLGDVIISSRIHNLNVSTLQPGNINEFNITGGIHPLVSDVVASLSFYDHRLRVGMLWHL